MPQQMQRRQFLASTLAAGAACGFFSQSSPGESDSPNERLDLAFIGVGNKGWHNIEALTGENAAVLCDVDGHFLDRAKQAHPRARTYRDYREMLDKEAAHIDAVVVSTADHNHAPATAMALRRGKHVYCEKPLTHTVEEARLIAQLAAEQNVATQMGNQMHASDNYRRVVELVTSGVLGPVREIYAWCNRDWSGGQFNAGDGPAPDHVAWDLWLGPATERPYVPQVHPKEWRRFWDFGSGTLGDMGCHIIDLAFWSLGLRHPTRIVSEGPPVDPVGAAGWLKVSYEFAATQQHGPVKLYWSDSGAHFDLVKRTTDRSGRPLSRWGLGILFCGERAMLAADYNRRELLLMSEFDVLEAPPETIPDSIGHWKEWVQACKTGSATACNFGYAGPLTETVLLGTVAYRAGVPLEWDAAQLKANGTPDAEQFITKEYRRGWELSS